VGYLALVARLVVVEVVALDLLREELEEVRVPSSVVGGVAASCAAVGLDAVARCLPWGSWVVWEEVGDLDSPDSSSHASGLVGVRAHRCVCLLLREEAEP
jgi:hypothetical protein